MRRVVNTDEVSHLWAHQSQDGARNKQGNLSFSGPDLHSYDWACIGRIDDVNGQRVATITERTYSNTTGRHISEARSATRHLRQVYVPDWVDSSPAYNRAQWSKEIDARAETVGSARNKRSRAKRYEALQATISRANDYCDAFGLEPFPVPSDVEIDAYLAARREQEERQRAEAEARAEAARKKELRKARGLLRGWLLGDEVSTYQVRALDTHFLRISPTDPETVETSRGARVPVEHVRRFAPIMLRLVRARKEWTPDDSRPIRFGHYSVDRIEANGTVHVGCHTFSRKEIERFASVLSEAPEPAPV